MSRRVFRLFFICVVVAGAGLASSGCFKDRRHIVEISVPGQRLAVYREGVRIREYPVSTSKFGVGDRAGSYQTPLGAFEIKTKIGSGAAPGTVFKSRRRTGEILAPDSPGRDPIVSRILWLEGMEPHNANAYDRFIYIHGTAEERTIGNPVSYGCIRLRSRDVIDLYGIVGRGARVYIVNLPLQGPPAAPAR